MTDELRPCVCCGNLAGDGDADYWHTCWYDEHKARNKACDERDALGIELAAVRRALNAADDSNLPAVAIGTMYQRRQLAEALIDALPTVMTEDDIDPLVLRLAHSIVNDEPAPASRWISVDERLPDEGRLVLLWNKRAREVLFGSYEVDEWSAVGRYYDASGVTHWRPLPPPPRGDDPAPASDGDERRAVGEALNETALQIIRDMWNNEVGSGSDMDWHLKQEGYTERMKNLLAVVDVIEGKNET